MTLLAKGVICFTDTLILHTRNVLMLGVVLCSACAPLVNRPGKPVQAPSLGHSHFAAADGAVLPMRSWLPPAGMPAKALIVALHGFNDYSRFFTGPGEYLSRRGFACYAYDQRGFGNSPGWGLWGGMDAYVEDVKVFIALLHQRHPGLPLYLLGESMGGAIVIVTMTSAHPPDVDGLILSAPAVWGRSTMPWYQRALLDTMAYVAPSLRLTGEGLKKMASDNLEMLRQLGRDPLFIKATRVDAMYGLTDLMGAALDQAGQLKHPTLVLYGEKDEIIPRQPVSQMLANMPPPPQTTVIYYPNGYHMLLRDLQAEKPLNDIVEWIENPAAPRP